MASGGAASKRYGSAIKFLVPVVSFSLLTVVQVSVVGNQSRISYVINALQTGGALLRVRHGNKTFLIVFLR